MNIRIGKKACNYLFLLLITLSLVACGVVIQRHDQVHVIRAGTIPSKVKIPNQVNVTFSVESPPVDLDNIQLALDILDDLSSYSDNIRRYPMQNMGDNHYEVNILLDEGFDIRYRYTMIEPAEVPETNVFGQLVDMRMAIAQQDLNIHDTILNWTLEPNNMPFGTISGTFLDSSTQMGIPDMMITVAGMQTFTDMSGIFKLYKIPEGTYNLVAYSVDGRYPVLQQEVTIVQQQTTKINLQFEALPAVKLQFQVTPPIETVGVPIRLNANLLGFGAHYENNFTQTGSIASLMPLLHQEADDAYFIEFELYAGTPFRYRYTIGDGYINAERSGDGLLVTRQFIVPKTSVTIEDEINTWRADDKTPITINIDAPINTPTIEDVSIQINRKGWNQSIPMWHLSDNKWIFILFSNGHDDTYELRFCRSEQCELSFDPASFEQPINISFSEATDIHHQIDSWHNWNEKGVTTLQDTESVFQSTLSGIELIKEYKPSDLVIYKSNLPELRKSGINWLILRPCWDVQLIDDLPVFVPSGNNFMFYHELSSIVTSAKETGMLVSVYPALNFPADASAWWETAVRSNKWWQHWYQEYAHFLENFAIFAEQNKLSHIIVGEDSIRFTLPEGIYSEEDKLGTPDHANDTWQSMLEQIKQSFPGKILWSNTMNNIPEYDFLELVDGYYILANYSDSTYDEQSFSQSVQENILPLQSNQQKEVYIALNIPAITLDAMGYTDHMNPLVSTINNDLTDFIDLENQANLYQDFACATNTFEWIKGISSRGFNLGLHLTDFSSSIFGKPAMETFLNCVNNSQ